MNSANSLGKMDSSSVAIIGMSGKFPRAGDIESFWQNLRAGVDAVTFFSDDELAAADVPKEMIDHPNYVKARMVLNGIDLMDAAFFGFTPREAEVLDPQHRLFLECAWEALESAGYVPSACRGLVGIFAGAGFQHYFLNNILSNPEFIESVGGLQAAIGSASDSLASIVSYKLNLRGPSISVQTFCSTSLVAVHLACQSLLSYECDVALAGGVAIDTAQGTGYLYQPSGIASPDGHCRTFDARAQGSIYGSGLGVVVLKRLSDAFKDRDTILAVIRGSAVNNDGSLKVAYTAPGIEGQSSVIVEALANAGVESESISYVETHGTATPLGDSIEMAALIKAFRATSHKKHFCAIGSVKPNVGHLDRAAGVANLIKATLALQHRELPPSLYFEEPNPDIDFQNSPFVVNTRLTPWETEKLPRRAGVSSFGVGGTNAHVILEEAPPKAEGSPSRRFQVLAISAKSESAVNAAVKRLATHLRSHPEVNIADVAFTLHLGRSEFNHRCSLVCSRVEDAIQLLESRDSRKLRFAHPEKLDQPVIFIFPGSEDFYPGMGLDLYRNEAKFRLEVEACAKALEPLLGQNLREVLFPGDGGSQNTTAPRLVEPGMVQPAVFVLEYALAQLLISWGIVPAAVGGCEVGEFVAATVAGCLSLEDALYLVVCRARITGGTTNSAFFSQFGQAKFMELMLEVTRTVRLSPPKVPCITSLTGSWLKPEEATDPQFWARSSQPGRFAEGVAELAKEKERIVISVGPGRSLASCVQQSFAAAGVGGEVIASMRDSGEVLPDDQVLLEAVGRLWLLAAKVDWHEFYLLERRYRVPLPTYPFERLRFWVEARADRGKAPVESKGKRKDIGDWFYQTEWRQTPAWKQVPIEELKVRQGLWLFFADTRGCGKLLADRLRQKNLQVVYVKMGPHFRRTGESIYEMDPGTPAHYQELLKALPIAPVSVVHLWGLEQPLAETEPAAARFAHAQRLGFYSLLHLSRVLGGSPKDMTLWCLTSDAQLPGPGGKSCPEKSLASTLCRVIPQEHLNIACRSIDVSWPEEAWQQGWLADQLMAEMSSEEQEGKRGDLFVAYRGTSRWQQRYQPVHLPPVDGQTLRPRGTYLITGGLGAVGMLLARHMATTAQARLVLTGRSPFPAKESWSNWLETHPSDDEIGGKIRQFLDWESMGAEVRVVQADSTDRAQMAQALSEFDELHGVIHAAGISTPDAFRSMFDLSTEQCEAHFRPKVYSLYVLEEMLAGRKLDFCVLFSSMSSILGGLSMGAYAAANGFLDAFVRRHNSEHPQFWCSVAWDPWRAREAQFGDLGRTLAEFEMEPGEGIEALCRVIGNRPMEQLVNSTGDLEARLDQWVYLTSLSGAGRRGLPRHERPNLKNPFVAPSSKMETVLSETWQDCLGVAPVGVHDNFFELGGNSLTAIQILSQLRQRSRIDLPLPMVLMNPTVADLAVAAELAIIERLEAMTDEQARVMAASSSNPA